ncbi:SMI1/KNR4 family protein [Paenibacillus terrae]|uniref:SMI1/KNR4 family protein n=1 Tax=Paenibacillus terrae TaxID=159743 RepID=A0A4U2PXD9_9BACL|nr:SMI1/KNR4 family protein [Paenibacillus terrae]TKH42886.1 SMI1/KNR4 family protein [Paenibacillus terrae]
MDKKADIRTSMKELFAHMDEAFFMDLVENVPFEMRDGNADEEGWIKWKPLPSQITEQEVRDLEETYHFELPPLLRSFIMSYHYVALQFDNEFIPGIYWSDCAFIEFPRLPVGQGLKGFHGLLREWSPLLSAGYIPFAIAEDDQGPVCLNAGSRHKDGDYPVVWFFHEDLKHLGEDELRIRDNLIPHVQGLFPSSVEMFNVMFKQIRH